MDGAARPETPSSSIRVVIYDLCTGRLLGGHQEDYLSALEQALAPLNAVTSAPYRTGGARFARSPFARLICCVRDFWRWLHARQPALVVAPNVSSLEFVGLFLTECLPGRHPASRVVFVMRREPEGITAAGWRADLLEWSVRSLARRGLIELVSDTPQAAKFWSDRVGRPCPLVTIPIRRPRVPPRVRAGATFALMGAFRVEKGAKIYDLVVETALALDPQTRVEMQIGVQGDDSVERRLAEQLRARWAQNPRVDIHDHLSGEAFTDLLYRADVVVLPYDVESYGVGSSGVLFEALAAGRLVISTPIQWAWSEYGQHPGVFWIDRADPASLGQAIAEAHRRLPEWRSQPMPQRSDDLFAQSWFSALAVSKPPVAPAIGGLGARDRMPNLFIVGARKAYTTSLFAAFEASPDIYCCPNKEPHFFCDDLHADRSIAQIAVTDPERYQDLFQNASGDFRYLTEASTNYLPSTRAAQNIKAASPDARSIILLRNPIDRAWSEYRMNRAYGHERAEFRAAIEAEIDGHEARRPYLFGRYVRRGLYADQIARYLDSFPRQQLLIKVVDRPGAGMRSLAAESFAFLGLGAPALPEIHKNGQVTPTFPWLTDVAQSTGLKAAFSLIAPDYLKQAARRMFYRPDFAKAPAEDRALLRTVFAPDIDRLETLLGESLDHWT